MWYFFTKQPINGVILAISIEDLLTESPEELTAHSNAIRKRLSLDAWRQSCP